MDGLQELKYLVSQCPIVRKVIIGKQCLTNKTLLSSSTMQLLFCPPMQRAYKDVYVRE